ncbi:MAG: hypothetical protein ACRENK_16540 [Gemmatimonadaceae bacterium]
MEDPATVFQQQLTLDTTPTFVTGPALTVEFNLEIVAHDFEATEFSFGWGDGFASVILYLDNPASIPWTAASTYELDTASGTTSGAIDIAPGVHTVTLILTGDVLTFKLDGTIIDSIAYTPDELTLNTVFVGVVNQNGGLVRWRASNLYAWNGLV